MAAAGEIAAGIAWLTDETRESFIPQMLNLDRLGALSFEKGCFPGQEIIARTRYLGRLKRRLYPGRVAAGEPPAPGDLIRSDGRSAGTIVASEREDAGSGHELLAVVAIELAGGRLECEDGRRNLSDPRGVDARAGRPVRLAMSRRGPPGGPPPSRPGGADWRFRPAWWLPGPHLQTLWGALFRRRGKPVLERERIELPDGDFLDP